MIGLGADKKYYPKRLIFRTFGCRRTGHELMSKLRPCFLDWLETRSLQPPLSNFYSNVFSTSFYLLCDINGTGIADRYDRKNEYFVWSNNLSHKYLIKFILISNDFFYNLKIFSDKQCIFFNLYFANKNWMIDCINRIWINRHKIGPYDILCLNDFEMW